MQSLIDNYSPTISSQNINDDTDTNFRYVTISRDRSYNTSLSFITRPYDMGDINIRQMERLAEISNLEDNWDDEGAIKPNTRTVGDANSLVSLMSMTGQKIFNIAPGYSGEIMVDLRNNTKSLELLFYPDKSRYVKFNSTERPEQGDFNHSQLPQLLSWLNS